MLIRATDWQLMFLYQLRRFRNMSFWYFFQTFFHENKALHTANFLIKMNHFNIVFHMTWGKWQRFQFLRSSFSNVSVSQEGCFFSQVQVPVQVQLLDNVLLLMVIPPSNNFTRALFQKTDTKFYVLLLLVFMQRKSRSKEIIFTFF